ncbi:MAG: hypothetical protein Q4B81_00165 [Moraxella sp.]|nr:hypothetical protein [Moraxella sp.]
MLQGLAKTKALKELKEVMDKKASLSGLALTKILKRQNELRADLGMGKITPATNATSTNVLSDDDIERLSQIKIDVQDDSSKGERKRTAKEWMKENLLGKSVRTVDNKLVYFNSNDTINHISFNAMRSRNSLIALCIPFIPVIFAKGEFVGREVSDHGRTDESIKAFHLYQKWVELKNGYKVNAEVQACERQDEKELFYAGYNLKVLGKKKAFDGLLETGLHHADQTIKAFVNSNTVFDKVQVFTDNQTLPLRILQVLNEHGVDITDELLDDDGWDGNDKTLSNNQPFDRTQIDIPKSKNARQKANNQAIAILDKLDGGELSTADLTDDDKAVLAKYSGNGGGLVGRDGKKGSDYEYYTPKELALGMWDLAKEMGFDGGRVLDPCAGTGIFTATSPDDVLIDAVELDETSGRINQLLNDGVRSHTTISPFEKVVNGYDDGDDESGFDLVISNVPFGDNAARGANKMYDNAIKMPALITISLCVALRS